MVMAGMEIVDSGIITTMHGFSIQRRNVVVFSQRHSQWRLDNKRSIWEFGLKRMTIVDPTRPHFQLPLVTGLLVVWYRYLVSVSTQSDYPFWSKVTGHLSWMQKHCPVYSLSK